MAVLGLVTTRKILVYLGRDGTKWNKDITVGYQGRDSSKLM